MIGCPARELMHCAESEQRTVEEDAVSSHRRWLISIPEAPVSSDKACAGSRSPARFERALRSWPASLDDKIQAPAGRPVHAKPSDKADGRLLNFDCSPYGHDALLSGWLSSGRKPSLIASEAKELFVLWRSLLPNWRDPMTSSLIERTSEKRFSSACSRTQVTPSPAELFKAMPIAQRLSLLVPCLISFLELFRKQRGITLARPSRLQRRSAKNHSILPCAQKVKIAVARQPENVEFDLSVDSSPLRGFVVSTGLPRYRCQPWPGQVRRLGLSAKVRA